MIISQLHDIEVCEHLCHVIAMLGCQNIDGFHGHHAPFRSPFRYYCYGHGADIRDDLHFGLAMRHFVTRKRGTPGGPSSRTRCLMPTLAMKARLVLSTQPHAPWRRWRFSSRSLALADALATEYACFAGSAGIFALWPANFNNIDISRKVADVMIYYGLL